MATNPGTVHALERIGELIDELNAWKRVLKSHTAMQKKQIKRGQRSEYVYDKKQKKVLKKKL